MSSPSRHTSIPLSYAQAIKSLSFSHISINEKLATCRHLLSSNYYPDPSATVLQFLSSCFSKDCPSVGDCYTIQDTPSVLPQQLEQQWSLMSQALSRPTEIAQGGFGHRESPLIADAVIIQGGLHLLRGPEKLKQTVSEALYLIVENTHYTRDIHTNTWLFCAVARAEGPRSLLAPLRSAVLSNYVKLLSREIDKDSVAAAAACIVSHAVPSDMALEIEMILVYAIRASLPSFQSKFAPWVLRSEVSLPHAIRFLLRAYAKHPLKKQEVRSSEKRSRWDQTQRDAAEFFDTLSQHIHDGLRVNRDPLKWDEKTFRSKIGAVCALYMTGSGNAIYSSAGGLGEGQEKKRRNTSGSDNQSLTNGSKTHGMLKLVLGATQLANPEAHDSGVRLQLIFQAIIAIADFSFVAIDDYLPEIMELFRTLRKENDTGVHISHKRKFFCALLNRYERSRAVNKLISHLIQNSLVLQALVPILRQSTVQIALASTFGNLRGAEGQNCLQSLVGMSRSSSTGILGLTMISSLLLEASSGPLLQLAADTIANDVVDILSAHSAAPDSRHCRMHLLASFLLAKTIHKSLSTDQTVRAAIFRLAYPDRKEDGSTSGATVESVVIDALTARKESLSPAELCSNLRCLTALIHYAFRYQNCSDDRKFISQSVRTSLHQFRVLTDLNKKANLHISQQSSLSRTLYESLSLETVLPWIGSLGYVLRPYISTETDDEAIEVLLKHSFFFFPAVHPFWRELSEETKCAPTILKVAILALNELSDHSECPKRMGVCSASRILETLSVLPVPLFNDPKQQDLLDYLLAYVKFPCCAESRQHALKAFLKLQNSPDFRKSLLALCRCQDNRDLLETKHRLLMGRSKGKVLSPYNTITAAMRVLASLIPEQLCLFLRGDVASVLTANIGRIRTDLETGLNPSSLCTDAVLCEMAEVLLDLRGNLHTITSMDLGCNKVETLEKATAECIKVVLPLCFKLLSKDSKENTTLSAAARDTLSAVLRSTSSKYGESSFKKISETIRNDQMQVCVSYLFHPRYELQKLAVLLLSKLSAQGEMSSQTLNQLFLRLLDRFFARIRTSLNSVLRNDSLPTESIRQNMLVATKLSTCCHLSCSAAPRSATSASDRRDSQSRSDFQAESNSSFVGLTRLLFHLEGFLRIWSLAVQDMSTRQLGRFRVSGLLSVSDCLVCSLLRSCLHIVNADRFWTREEMEKILLLTKQVVERVCSCDSFLENESTVLLIALRICRPAAKRHTALIPATTQIIGLLFRRSLSTENETVLIAVRQAVEEICVLTKTWETLSALLADCSTALTQRVGIESLREAERTVATLFKAVTEPKAQQVLGSLPDSGKETLTHVWQMYSDRLVYSGN